jgi:oligosaccharyltransferase complex subunit gamma
MPKILCVDGVLAFAVVSLAYMVPQLDDKWRQRIGVYIWTGCFIVIFSCLMALFKVKNEAYPFKILF